MAVVSKMEGFTPYPSSFAWFIPFPSSRQLYSIHSFSTHDAVCFVSHSLLPSQPSDILDAVCSVSHSLFPSQPSDILDAVRSSSTMSSSHASLEALNSTFTLQSKRITMLTPIEFLVLLLFTFTFASLILRPFIIKTCSGRSANNKNRKFRPESPTPDEITESSKPNPFQLPRLKKGMSTKMTMGLKRLDKANWLTLDFNYRAEHPIRSRHLDEHTSSVLQCLPGSEAHCSEVLHLVATFLSSRYPDSFTVSTRTGEAQGKGSGVEKEKHRFVKSITNHLTGEIFPLGEENTNPLDTVARLAMEDFSILVKDDEGQYRLRASATLFPVGWSLKERIGGTMVDLHAPVPNWKENLGASLNRYFDHLSPTTSMERHSLFLQTVPEIFQSFAPASLPSQSQTSLSAPPLFTPSQLHIRRERQTFTRLPISGAILFTVRTFITPLTTLDDDELGALVEIVGNWSEEMAKYKGREVWWGTLVQWAEERGVVVGENVAHGGAV